MKVQLKLEIFRIMQGICKKMYVAVELFLYYNKWCMNANHYHFITSDNLKLEVDISL